MPKSIHDIIGPFCYSFFSIFLAYYAAYVSIYIALRSRPYGQKANFEECLREICCLWPSNKVVNHTTEEFIILVGFLDRPVREIVYRINKLIILADKSINRMDTINSGMNILGFGIILSLTLSLILTSLHFMGYFVIGISSLKIIIIASVAMFSLIYLLRFYKPQSSAWDELQSYLKNMKKH